MNKLMNKPLERVLLCCLLSFCLAGFAQETTNSAETSSAETSSVEDGVVRATASVTISLPIPAELLEDEPKGVHILANPASATFVSQDDETTRHAATVSNTTINQLTSEVVDDEARASETPATASIADETLTNETLANETDASEIASDESNLSDTVTHEASTSEESVESISDANANVNTDATTDVDTDVNANDAASAEAPLSPETTLNATISNPNSNDVSLDEVTSEMETDDVLGVQEFVDNTNEAEIIPTVTADTFAVPVAADASSQAVEEARAITELDPEVFAIAQALRCPVCRAESVAESNAPISVEMRQIIQEKLEAGESREEILAYFQQRYNDYILLNPPKRGIHLIVWIAPLLAALIALWLFWRFMKRWTKQAETIPETDADELARVRALLDKETKAQNKERADD